jgi:glycine cleavage system H protein
MSEKKYTKDHEWIEIIDEIATIGITNHAQESLGDIVFVDLPEIGKLVTAGNEVSVIESVKAASDIYSPIDGVITEVNNSLNHNAALINEAAESEGWIFKVKINNKTQLKNHMSLSDYEEFLKQE